MCVVCVCEVYASKEVAQVSAVHVGAGVRGTAAGSGRDDVRCVCGR